MAGITMSRRDGRTNPGGSALMPTAQGVRHKVDLTTVGEGLGHDRGGQLWLMINTPGQGWTTCITIFPRRRGCAMPG